MKLSKLTALRRLTASIMLLVAAVGIAAAQTVPMPNRYYPGKKDAEPYMDYKGKCYIYFPSGSKVVSATASIIQNGESVGTLSYVYTGSAPGTTLMMDPAAEANADIENIQPGLFTISVYQLTYLDETGAETTYTDVENPLGEVTYNFPRPNGTVLTQPDINTTTILSYYPEDSEEGVLTFSFSKPIVAEDVKALFEYGGGDRPYEHALNAVVADDALSLTIDLRGVVRNVADYLAPGVTFYDDMGEPIDPPTTIILQVNHLNCQDGTKIQSVCVSLDGSFSINQVGKIYQAFRYKDLTFSNPVISDAKFWNGYTPSEKFEKITDTTNMMDVIVETIDVIESGYIVLTSGSTVARVNIANCTRRSDYFSFEIPAEIKALGSDALVISMEDVVFNVNDGITTHHVIPLDFGNRPIETTTLAEVLELEVGSRVTIRPENGLKVTFSSDRGYMFVEDSTAGMQIYPDNDDCYLTQGTKLTGKIVGVYQGNGLFEIDREVSNYLESMANVEVSEFILSDLSDLLSSDTYNNRLVTIVASDDLPIVYDEDSEVAMIGETLPAMLDFVENLEIPAEFTSLTGIYYNDAAIGMPMLIVRSNSDINGETVKYYTVSDLRELPYESSFDVLVRDMVITFSSDERWTSIVEDATGAMPFYRYGDTFLPAGTKFTGRIKGVAYTTGVQVEIADCELTSEPVDVTYGSFLSIDQARMNDNLYRLVTFENSFETPITVEGNDIFVGENIYVCDLLEVLDYDYEVPQDIKRVTGFIYPMNVSAADDIDDFGFPNNNLTYVVLRSVNDIKTTVDKEGDIDGDGTLNISDITAMVEIIVNAGYSDIADIDGNGKVEIADLTALIDLILSE